MFSIWPRLPSLDCEVLALLGDARSLHNACLLNKEICVKCFDSINEDLLNILKLKIKLNSKNV